MIYVLDTSTLSHAMRQTPPVAQRLAACRPSTVAICGPALAELRYGIERHRRGTRQRRELEAQYAAIVPPIPLLPWTVQVSELYGRLAAQLERAGARIDDMDVAIAAHAVVVGGTVVTANGKHFRRVEGLPVENWAS